MEKRALVTPYVSSPISIRPLFAWFSEAFESKVGTTLLGKAQVDRKDKEKKKGQLLTLMERHWGR